MKKQTVLKFIASLMICFLFGCCATLALHLFDTHFDLPKPLEGGQTIDFSAYGFTLTVPDHFALNDYTQNHRDEGGNALFAGCTYGGGQELYIYCYENAQGDDLAAYSEQTLVSHYMSAGAQDVRIRTFGGRPFVCYRAEATVQGRIEIWDTYETWDEAIHLVFETRMNPWDVLPSLQTITFTRAD